MARIVRHDDKSVRQGYIRNGGKEVKLFASSLKAFQCNNRIVMEQRKHLDNFLRGRIIGRLECGRGIPRNLESPRVSSPSFGNDSKMMLGTRYDQQNTIERHRYGCAVWFVWGEIILGSRTDLHVQSVTMTGRIYQDIILEQHVRLFRGTMGAEFLFMDDNVRPHGVNIVDECLQSEDITRMDWPLYSPGLNPIEHVWNMFGRRIAARQPSPTCLPKLRRVLSVEWCNIPQDKIVNLILRMPRRCKA
ncbi:transposable element Tc3 transposase [Trichonephila clavipes]|uniref:Transposable element Tc3 transposase n=1 Tax=Trichonephila clavipes TaxID=2585209 RepID=A0A8X7BAB4_TRICX|nr:transposable element Tc3 transposase [Trichonephila clavipes]